MGWVGGDDLAEELEGRVGGVDVKGGQIGMR